MNDLYVDGILYTKSIDVRLENISVAYIKGVEKLLFWQGLKMIGGSFVQFKWKKLINNQKVSPINEKSGRERGQKWKIKI